MSVTRLITRRVAKPWGRSGHLWSGIAPVPEGHDPIGEVWFETPGGEQPELLVKFLFTSEKLSIQVHPDDARARARGHAHGKDEAWVILSAEPHACIGLGTLRALSCDELRGAALDGSIEAMMDWKPVAPRDCFYAPAGTVHAIGPGLALVEVQQNADLTYRLYDYGRLRDLHLDDGVAASVAAPYVPGHSAYEAATGRTILADGPKLVLERWSPEAGTARLNGDGRRLWIVPLAGAGDIDGDALSSGNVWLVEGNAELTLAPACDLLVAYPGQGVIEGLWRP